MDKQKSETFLERMKRKRKEKKDITDYLRSGTAQINKENKIKTQIQKLKKKRTTLLDNAQKIKEKIQKLYLEEALLNEQQYLDKDEQQHSNKQTTELGTEDLNKFSSYITKFKNEIYSKAKYAGSKKMSNLDKQNHGLGVKFYQGAALCGFPVPHSQSRESLIINWARIFVNIADDSAGPAGTILNRLMEIYRSDTTDGEIFKQCHSILYNLNNYSEHNDYGLYWNELYVSYHSLSYQVEHWFSNLMNNVVGSYPNTKPTLQNFINFVKISTLYFRKGLEILKKEPPTNQTKAARERIINHLINYEFDEEEL